PAAIGGQDISWCRKGPERIGDHQSVQQPGIPAEVYDQFYKKFNPTLYNAREWVGIAHAAGMKYLVLTTKHHDGFCLFETRHTQHKITAPDCPFKRDVVKELADACHEAGMKFGLYYSARDWFHPDYLTENHGRYLAFYHAQLLELLCNYGQVDVLWFDHIGGPHSQWEPDIVFRMARALHPGILINDRLHASVHHGRIEEFLGDFDTPEQELGKFQPDRAWESCLCLVGGVWSYKPGGEMMSLEQCVHALVQCATGDGNLLLNTGPMPDGRIEPRQAERLKEIGDWLARHGESIYATRGGPLANGDWGGCTRRGSTVYLHILRWPGETLTLPPIKGDIVESTVLTGGTATVVQSETGLTVTLPTTSRAPLDTIVKLEVKQR
ncbi:MAG: alpha-L-fucosidase, partial [Synechococcaceae cyanobacterium]|nr:alpha-L-fucosidase [Synechococcaceae cyanobacterium]